MTDAEVYELCAQDLYEHWRSIDNIAPQWDDLAERAKDIFRGDVAITVDTLKKHRRVSNLLH